MGPHLAAGSLRIQTWLDKKGFSDASQGMAALGTEMKIIGRDFMIAGGLLAAPFAKAAQAAISATTDLRAFNTVFARSLAQANDFVTEFAKTSGRYQGDIRRSLTSVQALFKGLGYGERQALDMSTATQKMMADLAAFRGLADDDVMARFVSTISGGVEAMDQLGIDVHEAAVQTELHRMGIQKLVQDATEQEKVQARLAIIQRALYSQGAVGAATRSLDQIDGKVTQLTTSFKELEKAVGDALIPALEKLVPVTKDLVTGFQEFAESHPDVIRAAAGSTLALAGLGAAIWTAGSAWRVFAFGGGWFAKAFGPAGIASLAAYGVLLGRVMDLENRAQAARERRLNTNRTDIAAQRDINRLTDEQRQKVAELRGELQRARDAYRSDVRDNWQFQGPLKGPLEFVRDTWADTDEALSDLITGNSARIQELQAEIQNVFDEADPVVDKTEKIFDKIGDSVEDSIADGFREGTLRGIQGTFSILSERMFANLSSGVASAVSDGFKGSEDEVSKASEIRSNERIEEAIQRTREIDAQLRNPNLREGERSRLEQAREEAQRDLARERINQAEQQQRRQQDPGQMSEEEIREMWRNRRQLGQGESWLDPGRKRFQDPGAYIIGDDGEELHYQERGTDPNVPPELQQGGPFGQPYTGPYTGGSSPSGPGPYYIGPDGQMMSGPLAGATEFPVAPGPGDMPAFGGMGGGYERSVEERFAEADAENQAILTQMRDLLQQMVDELRNPDRQDTW